MTLGELIKRLEALPQNMILQHGFYHPHSYRGYYEDLAFEPQENVSIGTMLACAKEALGKMYFGWKGGEYTMYTHTIVWLANYGDCGEQITEYGLRYMLSETNDKEVEVARAYWLMQLPYLVVGTDLENHNARNKLTILLNATKGA